MTELTFQKLSDVSELTPITLSASDTFTLPKDGRSYMQIVGSAAKTVLLTGTGVPVNVQVTGYGEATFNALSIAVEDAKTYIQPLNPHVNLLQGTVTITGGDALVAYLYTL